MCATGALLTGERPAAAFIAAIAAPWTCGVESFGGWDSSAGSVPLKMGPPRTGILLLRARSLLGSPSMVATT